ncbi:MAG TPA: acyl-CoA dehydrogenase [Candidatus Binataceae bacterium]|nr:acyl-CoA dehydrogenase [Candidatus Binataceae bacterium]
MDFEYTPDQEEFRREVRGWLDANLPEDLKIDDAADERVAPNRDVFERRRAFQRKLGRAGWNGLSWPREYGGRAASLIEQIIWDEEYARARAPVLPGYSGLGLCGPTLMHWGTEAQKKRFLPRILSGDDIWCQGYSEPGAGSDLASLQTRALDRGDNFLLNGQKVWTSGAQYADWMFLLARTDPAAPKHRGISYLLLEMKSPGVEVRPLVLMNGHAHFNEVFFTDVQVPKENLVGPLNEGWKVAMTTLMYERSGGGGGGHKSQVRRLAELAQTVEIDGRPAWEQEWVRQRLAQFAMDCEAAKYTHLRTLTRRLKGLAPGPEGSMLKLFGSELGMAIARFASEMLGSHALLGDPSPIVPDAPRWLNRVLSARQYTIAGGTSEIQRNIIGERTLGLPKG